MTDSKRSKRINVRLSDELSDRLDTWSKKMGIAPSTLAAVAIGEYINTKETNETNMQKSSLLVSRQIGNAFTEMFSDPEAISSLVSGLSIDEKAVEDQLNIGFDEGAK